MTFRRSDRPIHLHFVTDYRAYFDPRNPDYQQLAGLEARFGPSDDILLAYAPTSESRPN